MDIRSTVIISNKGNISGNNADTNNEPSTINKTLTMDLEVKIDLWVVNDQLYLGDITPLYLIDLEFIIRPGLIIQCRNIEALKLAEKHGLHYFWNEKDTFTITSQGIIVSYARDVYIPHSIYMCSETDYINMTPYSLSKLYAICTDYPLYVGTILNSTNS